MADTKPGYGADADLNRYWTKGKGLAKWAGSSHPFTTLVAALSAKGVPAGQVKGLAASYYHAVFGRWPGRKKK